MKLWRPGKQSHAANMSSVPLMSNGCQTLHCSSLGPDSHGVIWMWEAWTAPQFSYEIWQLLSHCKWSHPCWWRGPTWILHLRSCEAMRGKHRQATFVGRILDTAGQLLVLLLSVVWTRTELKPWETTLWTLCNNMWNIMKLLNQMKATFQPFSCTRPTLGLHAVGQKETSYDKIMQVGQNRYVAGKLQLPSLAGPIFQW